MARKKTSQQPEEKKDMASLCRSVERKYCGTKFSHIIGVDEAGRGPLAGPVVAAACMIDHGVTIAGIIDSKQTKEEDRERTYEILINHPSVYWGVSIVSHTEIDEVNILQASMNAMKKATDQLLTKLNSRSKSSKVLPAECIALIDGNRVPLDMALEAQYVIKGDGSIFSIAAASIIAKVTRDRLMVDLDKQYPMYNLAQHKGYPTFAHRSLLHEHGASDIHRLTFGPVKLALEKHGGVTVFSNLAPPRNVETMKTKKIKSKSVAGPATIEDTGVESAVAAILSIGSTKKKGKVVKAAKKSVTKSVAPVEEKLRVGAAMKVGDKKSETTKVIAVGRKRKVDAANEVVEAAAVLAETSGARRSTRSSRR